jgi:hypothetical protein
MPLYTYPTPEPRRVAIKKNGSSPMPSEVEPAVGDLAEQAFPSRRGPDGRFLPGCSGNVRGIPKIFHECKKIAREASPRALIEMIERALDPATDQHVKAILMIGILGAAADVFEIR